MADDKRCARCGEPRDAHIDMRDGKPTNGKYLVIFLCPTTVYKPLRALQVRPAAVFDLPKGQRFVLIDHSTRSYVDGVLEVLDQLSFDEGTLERRTLKEAQHALHELRRLL